MEARTAFLILSGAFQVVLSLEILAAEGRRRVRASLATLFLFNGMVAFFSIPPSDPRFVNALDWPTGALLIDAGVLLSAGRLARWERTSGAVALLMIGLLPLLAFAPEPWTLYGLTLADITVYAGWSVSLAGATLGYMRSPSRFQLAALFALGPRPIEYAFYMIADLVRGPRWGIVGQLDTWRIPALVLTVVFLLWALKRASAIVATALSTIIVAGFAFWYGARFVRADLQMIAVFSTLVVWRPGFILAALWMGRGDDPLLAARIHLGPRIGLAAAGGSGVLGLVLLFPVLDDLAAIGCLAGTLWGYGIGVLVAHPREEKTLAALSPAALDAPVMHKPEGLGPTQGERVLLALRGIVVEPGHDAPARAGTTGLGEAAGVLGKHIPIIVRRMNEKAIHDGLGPLIGTDQGGVVGVRQRAVPRYWLTRGGESEAAAIASKGSNEPWRQRSTSWRAVDQKHSR